MYIMRSKIPYANQNFYESKLLVFQIFRGWHQFIFLKKSTYVNKATLLIFDIKFNLVIGTNIPQIVLGFIPDPVVS